MSYALTNQQLVNLRSQSATSSLIASRRLTSRAFLAPHARKLLVDPAQRLQLAQPAGLESVLRIDARLARGEGGAERLGVLLPLREERRPVVIRLDVRHE